MRIFISHYAFDISSPYIEGFRLGEAEASALNALRAENIHNAAYRQFKKLHPAGKILTPDELRQFASKIAELDLRYEFRTAPADNREGALDRELRLVANLHISEQERSNGTKVADYDGVLRLLVDTPEVQAEARRRLAARVEITKSAIEDLF